MVNATLDDQLPAVHTPTGLSAVGAPDWLLVTVDPLGRVTGSGGPALARITTDGRPLVGRPLPAALRTAPAVEEALREALDDLAVAVRGSVADSEFDIRAAPLYDGAGHVGGAVAVATQTVPEPPAPTTAEDFSDRDGAAVRQGEGFPGRATVEAALESAVRAARRGITSALLHVKIGDLGLVNRAFGRAVGDALLGDTAAALRELFPHPTVICRTGSSDFAILAEHLGESPDAAAAEAAATILAQLEGIVPLDGREVRRTVHVRVALVATGEETPTELLELAEDEIADHDTGRCVIARPDGTRRARAVEDLRIVARLPGAGARNELRLLYQPIYDLTRERLYGVEALLRWTDPELGPVSPGRFIPLSEASGAIHELGGWVIDELCRHSSGWDLEERPFKMHFNASVVELQRPGYARDVLRRIAGHGLTAGRFVVELTESAAVLDPRRTFEVLGELRAAGMSVAIDDFGAGHSSLNRLKDLPADVLKIDRGIVSHVHVSREARAIVTAAVCLADELGMSIVAEGIETAEQRNCIVRSGCTYGQGFMLGRPSATVPRR